MWWLVVGEDGLLIAIEGSLIMGLKYMRAFVFSLDGFQKDGCMMEM